MKREIYYKAVIKAKEYIRRRANKNREMRY